MKLKNHLDAKRYIFGDKPNFFSIFLRFPFFLTRTLKPFKKNLFTPRGSQFLYFTNHPFALEKCRKLHNRPIFSLDHKGTELYITLLNFFFARLLISRDVFQVFFCRFKVFFVYVLPMRNEKKKYSVRARGAEGYHKWPPLRSWQPPF